MPIRQYASYLTQEANSIIMSLARARFFLNSWKKSRGRLWCWTSIIIHHGGTPGPRQLRMPRRDDCDIQDRVVCLWKKKRVTSSYRVLNWENKIPIWLIGNSFAMTCPSWWHRGIDRSKVDKVDWWLRFPCGWMPLRLEWVWVVDSILRLFMP